ncbi:sigma-70 family RNA polymerase sigma factor [Companilactobacillus halodurans]|uniref:Sigma-70 family RNA polymerase sigma factor n=1 Tax=Companilactobacillus halodurans TaxID=2584183 RepID=A0A5P0ZND6_9LACO|nr:sigma-70 family RNA polymerase sigma factor [Companilactobacillus halodurans]MQS75743.1 sigma-70 family RNA polymerase sigma factor [Companilactobacillus halodurans]MQS98053.1 sigma-70 family RNA polymerase sigma factor [Companilactobacillus halodurans]
MSTDMEKLWIDCVKETDDSIALGNLVRRYQPMINNMKLQYFITGYDINDWYQDAMLICYQTCKIFDGNGGSKFGSFFKLKLRNHVIDKIRHENAYKRRANIHTKPLSFVDLDDDQDLTAIENCNWLEVKDQIQDIIKDLSKMELLSFQYILGKISKEEACQLAKCDLRQIERAIKRCEVKIRKRKLQARLS